MAGPYPSSAAENYVGIGVQTVKATGVAPTLFAAYLPSVDLDHAQAINRILEAGQLGEVTFAEKVAHMPTGAFAALARPSLAGQLYAYQLGADSVAGAGPYDHTITPDSVTDYLSIEQNLADEGIERFVDCVIGETVLSFDESVGSLRLSVTWVGLEPSFQAAATAETYETDNPFHKVDGVWTIDGAGATDLRGVTVTVRRRYSLPIVDDVIADYAIKVGLEVEVETVQLMLDVDTNYRETHYGSPSGTTYTTTPDDGALTLDFDYGSGAGARGLQIAIPALDWHQAQYTGLNPDGEGVFLTRSGVARNNGSNPLLTVDAKTNDSAAYVS